jgi:hypothetical protein
MIVVRINWNIPLTGPARNDALRHDPDWPAVRWDLFSRYTLPSLQAQTEPSWQAWLCYDPAIRDPIVDHVRFLAEPRVRMVHDLPAAARSLAASPPEPLIFMRLDSDDLLHPGALARLCAELPGLVQFGYGYMVHLPGGDVYEWNHPSGPFIARIGDSGMCLAGQPDLGGNHMQVRKLARRIADRRWYTVLVHGRNLCNTTERPWVGRQLAGKDRDRVLDEFGVHHVL